MLGVIVAEAPLGRPAMVSATLPLKPFVAETETL